MPQFEGGEELRSLGMPTMRNKLLAASAAIALSSCATIDYSTLQPGRFTGSVIVLWVGEGDTSGDGEFLFVPDPKRPLTFYRPEARRAGAVIRPSMMYTDGGSIPKIAQIFRGFSPWGYAPAYMIHDWLFTARHCLVDGATDSRYMQVSNVSFAESAEILGEAINGLVAARQVQPNDLAGSTITAAVGSSIAKDLWDVRGACASLQVRPEHVAAAEAAIPGSSVFATGPAAPAGRAVVPPARVVARVSF